MALNFFFTKKKTAVSGCFRRFGCRVAACETKKKNQRVVYTLSGGAAYGYAHIGILKFLEEHNLYPHAIVGTSMGAIVGGLYACGLSTEEIRAVAYRLRSAEIMRLFFPSFPRGGVIDTSNIREFLLHYTEDKRIEDLHITFRSVAVDIETGEEVIFDSGPVIDAMVASMSIPALFNPYSYRGRLLVDGGVLNNLPWDVAKELGNRHIVVNVAPHKMDHVREKVYTSALPATEGEEVDKGKKKDGGKRNKLQTFFTSMRKEEDFSFTRLVNSLSKKTEKEEEPLSLPEVITNVMGLINEKPSLPSNKLIKTYLYIHPDLHDYSLNDFYKAEEIIDVGYQTARDDPAFRKGVIKLSSAG